MEKIEQSVRSFLCHRGNRKTVKGQYLVNDWFTIVGFPSMWVFQSFQHLQVYLYSSCAIGRSEGEEGSPVTMFARPFDEMAVKSKHSCVAIRGHDNRGHDEVWYAVLQGLLSFQSNTRVLQSIKGNI